MSASARADAPAAPRPRLPWVVLSATVLLVVLMLVLSLGREELFDTLLYGSLALALGTTGAFVASARPENPIGWIFCGLGFWGGVVESWEAFAYHGFPTAGAGTWLVGWSWIVDLSGYALVFLLFPSGRLLSRRWRWAPALLAVAALLAIPGQSVSPETADNPLAVESPALEGALTVGLVLLMVTLAAAIVSVVLRYRRATGIERLQLRQLVFAGAVLVPVMAVAIPFYYDSVLVQVVVGVVLLALPVAAGLAILRYRLYDLDVVINRTLVYGSLTVTLAGVYVASILLLQLLLSSVTQGSGFAVAASTLAVAALFGPVRARIQRTVDRRFFRSRYDAARTVAAFGARLRDEVDLATLGADLRDVVDQTMRPAHVTLWLRSGSDAR